MEKLLTVGKKVLLMFITGLAMITANVLFISVVSLPLILQGFGVISMNVAVVLFIVILSLLFGSAYYDDFN